MTKNIRTGKTETCGITRAGDALLCSIHRVKLEQLSMDEVMSTGNSPHPYASGAWRCPISKRIIPEIRIQ